MSRKGCLFAVPILLDNVAGTFHNSCYGDLHSQHLRNVIRTSSMLQQRYYNVAMPAGKNLPTPIRRHWHVARTVHKVRHRDVQKTSLRLSWRRLHDVSRTSHGRYIGNVVKTSWGRRGTTSQSVASRPNFDVPTTSTYDVVETLSRRLRASWDVYSLNFILLKSFFHETPSTDFFPSVLSSL